MRDDKYHGLDLGLAALMQASETTDRFHGYSNPTLRGHMHYRGGWKIRYPLFSQSTITSIGFLFNIR